MVKKRRYLVSLSAAWYDMTAQYLLSCESSIGGKYAAYRLFELRNEGWSILFRSGCEQVSSAIVISTTSSVLGPGVRMRNSMPLRPARFGRNVCLRLCVTSNFWVSPFSRIVWESGKWMRLVNRKKIPITKRVRMRTKAVRVFKIDIVSRGRSEE
jgi:hypothetical protein